MKTTLREVFYFTFPGLLLIVLTACGGGSSSPAPMTASTYTIGGSVTGLPSGSGLVLQNNAGDDVAVCTDCAFTFTAALANGAAYAVTVKTQPSSPAQNCVVVGNGSGTVDGANVTDVAVVCYGRFAYAANAGDNTISVYSIDSTTGALTAFGSPVPTGTSPYAIAARPDGQYVYVVNEISNNISVYAVNVTSRALIAIPGSPFAAGGNPHSLAVQPFGPFDYGSDFLYTANFNGTSSTVSGFRVDTDTGALTALSGSPFAVPVSNYIGMDGNGSYLYVTTGASVVGYSIDPNTGLLFPAIS